MSRITVITPAARCMRRLAFSMLCVAGLLLTSPSMAEGVSSSPLWSQPGNTAAVAFSPDGTLVAAAHNIGSVYTVKVYQADTGTLVRIFSGHTSAILSVVFSPDGQTLAAGSQTEILLWQVSDGTLLRTLVSKGEQLAFSTDGLTLTSACRTLSGATVTLWQVSTGASLHISSFNNRTWMINGPNPDPWGDPECIPHTRCTETLHSYSLSPDGSIVAVSWTLLTESWVGTDFDMRTTHTSTYTKLVQVSTDEVIATISVCGVGSVFSPNGEQLALWDSSLTLYRLNDKTLLCTIATSPQHVSLTSEFAHVVTACGSMLKYWCMSNGLLLGEFDGGSGTVQALTISPDGQTMVVGGISGVTAWRTLTFPRSDAQIRVAASSYLGNDIYNIDESQVATQTKSSGTVATYHLKFENDGNGSDTYTVVGDGDSAGATIRYYDALEGGTDITSEITEARWSTGRLNPGDSVEIRQEVTLTAQTPYGSSHEALVTVISNHDGTRSDTVTSSTTRPLLTGVALVTDLSSPQKINTSIRFTATPTGGENVEYRFLYAINDGPLQEIQSYSQDNICNYTPTVPGSYVFWVWAREQGSTAEKEREASRAFQCYLPLSSVTVNVSPSTPQVVETPLTITATPTNGWNPQFQYSVSINDGAFTRILSYTDSRQCVYTPHSFGVYRFLVWAREVGNSANWEVYGISPPYQVEPQLLTEVSLHVTPTAPQFAGTALTLAATPSGGATVEYRFFASRNSDTPEEIRGYATTSTCTFTPAVDGSYTFTVWARNVGDSTNPDVYQVMHTVSDYQVNLFLYITSGTHFAGTPLTLAASADTTGSIEYRFFASRNGGAPEEIRPYSTTKTCSYTPEVDGGYTFIMWARRAGSSTDPETYQAVYTVDYQVYKQLSGVALTASPTSPQLIDVPITVTATPDGGRNVEYRFFLDDGSGFVPLGAWAYGLSNTRTWTPTTAGAYTLLVWAREIGNTTTKDCYKTLAYRIIDGTAPPLTTVTLTADPPSPQQVNTQVMLTATAVGGTNVEYRFYVFEQNAWTILHEYSSEQTCAWTPTAAGTYTFMVWAQEHGAPPNANGYQYQVYDVLQDYVVQTPLTGVALAASPSGQVPLGEAVTLTATPEGGSQVEYRFLLFDGTAWVTLQGYSTATTCQWTPSNPGSYTVMVYAREVGYSTFPSVYQEYATLPYTVTGEPLSAVSLAASPVGSTLAGSAITLIATPTGGNHVEYRFFKTIGGVTTTIQPYTVGASTFQITPTEMGQYQFVVWAREQGSAIKYAASVMHKVNPPLSAVILKATPALPQAPGTVVTLKATQVNGGQIEYRFYAAEPGGALQIIQPYGTADTCTFTVTQQGTYQFLVYGREVGATVTKQAHGAVTYNCATPITSVDLAANPTPGTVNTPLTLTATAHGGYKVQYRFFACPPGGAYTTIQHYTLGDNTCDYTPTTPGRYYFLVYVRETYSTKPGKDAYKVLTYTVQ